MRIGSILFFFVSGLFFACIRHNNEEHVTDKSTGIELPEIHHAKGFRFEETDSTVLFQILYPVDGKTADSGYLKHSDQTFPVYTFERTAIQSTTYFAFFERLGKVDELSGICGKKYLSQEQKNKAEHLEEICSDNGFNMERIAGLGPDVLFLYPFEQKDVERFHRLGIKTVLITEYLESTPLARAEWLKFFGVLTGSEKAETIFEEIETDYLKNQQNEITASVALNLPFGEHWNMPSGNSITANLMKDAGLEYVFSDRKEDGNVVLSMEEGYSVLAEAEYWVIISEREPGYTMEKLLGENKVYASFRSVREGKVIFCNTAENDYFSKGVIEPHVMLEDLLVCLGKKDATRENTYFHILK